MTTASYLQKEIFMIIRIYSATLGFLIFAYFNSALAMDKTKAESILSTLQNKDVADCKKLLQGKSVADIMNAIKAELMINSTDDEEKLSELLLQYSDAVKKNLKIIEDITADELNTYYKDRKVARDKHLELQRNVQSLERSLEDLKESLTELKRTTDSLKRVEIAGKIASYVTAITGTAGGIVTILAVTGLVTAAIIGTGGTLAVALLIAAVVIGVGALVIKIIKEVQKKNQHRQVANVANIATNLKNASKELRANLQDILPKLDVTASEESEEIESEMETELSEMEKATVVNRYTEKA